MNVRPTPALASMIVAIGSDSPRSRLKNAPYSYVSSANARGSSGSSHVQPCPHGSHTLADAGVGHLKVLSTGAVHGDSASERCTQLHRTPPAAGSNMTVLFWSRDWCVFGPKPTNARSGTWLPLGSTKPSSTRSLTRNVAVSAVT